MSVCQSSSSTSSASAGSQGIRNRIRSDLTSSKASEPPSLASSIEDALACSSQLLYLSACSTLSSAFRNATPSSAVSASGPKRSLRYGAFPKIGLMVGVSRAMFFDLWTINAGWGNADRNEMQERSASLDEELEAADGCISGKRRRPSAQSFSPELKRCCQASYGGGWSSRKGW